MERISIVGWKNYNGRLQGQRHKEVTTSVDSLFGIKIENYQVKIVGQERRWGSEQIEKRKEGFKRREKGI